MILAVGEIVLEKYIQWGFAGFCFLLIGFIVWIIRTHNSINEKNTNALVGVIKENNKVLAKVFDGLKAVEHSDAEVRFSVEKMNTENKEQDKEIVAKIDRLREMFLARPCIKDKPNVS